MRDHLAVGVITPELVLCSSALRARQTLARVLPVLGSTLEVRIEPSLYTFDVGVLLDRLSRVSADVASVLLVGHNPAMQELAERIADRGERLDELSLEVPDRPSPRSRSAWIHGSTWRSDQVSSSGSSCPGSSVSREPGTSVHRRGYQRRDVSGETGRGGWDGLALSAARSRSCEPRFPVKPLIQHRWRSPTHRGRRQGSGRRGGARARRGWRSRARSRERA